MIINTEVFLKVGIIEKTIFDQKFFRVEKCLSTRRQMLVDIFEGDDIE